MSDDLAFKIFSSIKIARHNQFWDTVGVLGIEKPELTTEELKKMFKDEIESLMKPQLPLRPSPEEAADVLRAVGIHPETFTSGAAAACGSDNGVGMSSEESITNALTNAIAKSVEGVDLQVHPRCLEWYYSG